jgi:uncharacterized membrane protein
MSKKQKSSNNVKDVSPSKPKADEKKTTPTEQNQPLSADSERILSALAYPIGIIIALILILVSKPQNKIGKFNGFQGLFFGISWLVIYGVITVFSAIPIIGFVFSIVGSLVSLAFFVWGILIAVQVYQGKTVKLPVLYDLVPASYKL